jgi:hypothetical protein
MFETETWIYCRFLTKNLFSTITQMHWNLRPRECKLPTMKSARAMVKRACSGRSYCWLLRIWSVTSK